MTIYRIRSGFTIAKNGITYLGGQDVDLDESQLRQHRHKLEGIPSSIELEESGGFPAPYVSSIFPEIITSIDSQITLTIAGSFFTPDLKISFSRGVTVSAFRFKSDNAIEVDIVATATLKPDLILDNGTRTVIPRALDIYQPVTQVIDLRLGGTDFSESAIVTTDGMSFVRSESGLYFNVPSNNLDNSALFVGDNDIWSWSRTHKKRISWIFTLNDSQSMVGLSSTEANLNTSPQYGQHEILAYCISATSFYGFYGNIGTPGGFTSQYVGSGRSYFSFSNTVKKITFENNGEAGSICYLYGLQSANIEDWSSTINPVASFQLANEFTADASTIIPCIITPGTNSVFLGFILEDSPYQVASSD